ncbi:MAG: complex I NDUFA9 subunit family protein [Burkholderiaceae bacterium]
MPNNILVLGGSGFVGRSLCEKLVERSGGAGCRIVVPSRRPHRAAAIRFLPTVEVVRSDVHVDRDLARLMRGVDTVINLVAILHGSPETFKQVHVDLPQRLSKACQQAGVKRLVHVSALGVQPDAPSNYLRSKTAGEAVLQASGLDVTILRPSVIFGEHDRFINLFAQLQAVFPVMPLAGSDAKFQPVWVEDVASAITACLVDPSTIGQTIECAGPQVFTLGELVHLAGLWAGHARPVLPLPMFMGQLQALAMELLPGEPLMSRDNLASMKTPNVASGKLPDLARLGIQATAIGQVMPEVLTHRLGPARLDPWRARAGRD